MQKTLMAHALKRIAFATCFPDQRQFSFIAREPKSSTDDQFCHAFRARSAHEVWLIVSPHHHRHHDYSILWRGGVGSSPGRSASRNDSLGKLFTHAMCLCSPSSINWYRQLAGKVTIGLASHWPCVTDTATGSMAWEREMSTTLKLHSEYYGIFTFCYRVKSGTFHKSV